MNTEKTLRRLAEYVNLPSGSDDLQGLAAFSARVEADMQALGFIVTRHSTVGAGDTLECVYGTGKNTILLLGHMDTVFSREESQPFAADGDTVFGSGVMDMKGGLLIMQEALSHVLTHVPKDARIVAVLDADEEIGSASSRKLIRSWAERAYACLSFEPMRENGMLVRQRKGVLSFGIKCTGIRGHAGSAYLRCASANQQLCRVVNALYTLRDDEREISINVGVIRGGTAENVISDKASLLGEIRFFDPAYGQEMTERLHEICSASGVPGTTTTLTIQASHPPCFAGEKSAALLTIAKEVGTKLGMTVEAEDTGGAGDVSFASQAGIAVLDGLGLRGSQAHTTKENGMLSSFAQNAKLSEGILLELLANPKRVM